VPQEAAVDPRVADREGFSVHPHGCAAGPTSTIAMSPSLRYARPAHRTRVGCEVVEKLAPVPKRRAPPVRGMFGEPEGCGMLRNRTDGHFAAYVPLNSREAPPRLLPIAAI
jgi:hypothetical protein